MTHSPIRTTVLKPVLAFLAMLPIGLLVGCQNIYTPKTTQATTSANTPIAFAITGKIGVIFLNPQTQKLESGSAFYAWGQEDSRFAIDITGALGLGKTHIEGNGSSATLVSQSTGELTAETPDELLYKAAKWHAPISQLPFWILGKPTKTAANSSADGSAKNNFDELGRLTASAEADWQVSLSYREQNPLPYKLKMTQAGTPNKVVLSINGR